LLHCRFRTQTRSLEKEIAYALDTLEKARRHRPVDELHGQVGWRSRVFGRPYEELKPAGNAVVFYHPGEGPSCLPESSRTIGGFLEYDHRHRGRAIDSLLWNGNSPENFPNVRHIF